MQSIMTLLNSVGITLLSEGYRIGLDWLGQFVQAIIESVGIIGVGIICFTLILKAITLPFDTYQRYTTRKQTLIMRSMREDLDKLQKQYANDKTMYNQKMMELYKKNGYSVFGACLPMIISFVVIIVAFQGFNAYSRYANLDFFVQMSSSYNAAITAHGAEGIDFMLADRASEEEGYRLVYTNADGTEQSLSFGAPGEENRCGEHPSPAGLTRRIWPAQGGEGHFMAKLRKSPDAPAAVSKRTKPARPPKPCAEWLAFAAEYFPALKGQSAQAAGERLFLPPQGWQGEGLKLSIARCGVTLGRAQKGRFEPDHHLFMAFGPECENREELTLGDPRTEAWLRGEEIEAVTAQNGWCAVLVDGLPLGGGKVSGGRVKNHYPKALRNLK